MEKWTHERRGWVARVAECPLGDRPFLRAGSVVLLVRMLGSDETRLMTFPGGVLGAFWRRLSGPVKQEVSHANRGVDGAEREAASGGGDRAG